MWEYIVIVMILGVVGYFVGYPLWQSEQSASTTVSQPGRRKQTLQTEKDDLEAAIEREVQKLRSARVVSDKSGFGVNKRGWSLNFCPQCGQKVVANTRFCQNCGLKLDLSSGEEV